MAENADGPIFRANKRRKTYRKRAQSDDDEDIMSEAPAAGRPLSDEHPMKGDEDAPLLPDVARVRKPKKNGIAFSSSDRPSSRPHEENEELAVTVAEPQNVSESTGRFARQTGKAIVADDKHMSAYIDSKMAELRSSTSTPKPTASSSDSLEVQGLDQPQPSRGSTGQGSTPLSPSGQPPNNGVAIPATPAATVPRPTTSQPTSNRRHGRQPRQPSPSTQARASLIDEIMRESNHTPHYTPANPTASTSNDTSLDPDAAAAAAFRADFLAQAEARNLSRRKPAVNATATAATASGPKLGGSRSARERMKAAEEAKAKK